MKVPHIDATGQVIGVIDSSDLTDEEWASVKKHPSGAFDQRVTNPTKDTHE